MCRKIVEDTWHTSQGKMFQEKINSCAMILASWGKEITGSFQSRTKQCKENMKLNGRMDTRSVQLYNDATKRLDKIYIEQEVFWKQRCKKLWLREGDSNNKFFLAATKARRIANKINSLTNSERVVVGWESGQKETTINYFSNLFTSSNTVWDEIVVFAGVFAAVSQMSKT